MATRIAERVAASAGGSAGIDPRVEQKATFFQGLNEGSAEHAAKITGLVSGGKREDVSFCDIDSWQERKLTLSGRALLYEQ